MNKIHFLKQEVNSTNLPQAFPNPFAEKPSRLANLAIEDCLSYLNNENNWKGVSEYQNIKQHNRIGKMFGVLVVQTPLGKYGYLSAFSGKLLGQNNYDFFVPPIFDMLKPNGYYLKVESELFDLNSKIQEKESQLIKAREQSETYVLSQKYDHQISKIKQSLRKGKDASNTLRNEIAQLNKKKKKLKTPMFLSELESEVKALKKQRQNQSKALQIWLFDQYKLLNIHGESKSLKDIFKNKTIPSGSGECAAPKLLQYSFINNLKPICLAEFWWGRSTNSGDKQDGNIYPPCKEKCQYILTHMLKDLN